MLHVLHFPTYNFFFFYSCWRYCCLLLLTMFHTFWLFRYIIIYISRLIAGGPSELLYSLFLESSPVRSTTTNNNSIVVIFLRMMRLGFLATCIIIYHSSTTCSFSFHKNNNNGGTVTAFSVLPSSSFSRTTPTKTSTGRCSRNLISNSNISQSTSSSSCLTAKGGSETTVDEATTTNNSNNNNNIEFLSSLESFDTFGEWALSYADLSPETTLTPTGIIFLLTNIAYSVAGGYAITQGRPVLGTFTEFASIASFAYHYFQLQTTTDTSDRMNRTVKIALLIDYCIAITSIGMGTYILYANHVVPSTDIIVSVVGALTFLGFSWIWETGFVYIVNHSVWHLLSAYTAYLIGTTTV